jgi:hypothetical protein
LLALLALGLLLAACSSSAPGTSLGTSTGTDIRVAPEFETFYEQYGGARIFGFPISNPFVDSESGRLVQYFQQLHLEFDRVGGTVMVSPLGEHYAPDEGQQTVAAVSENGRQRAFPETGFIVQDEFLVFYEANGDTLVFGLPITPQLNEGGKLVQYFQNAQLVWNPNALPEFRVEVASLGGVYLWQFGSPVDESLGISDSATVLEADVSATIKEPILYAGETQVLYVSVITPDSLRLVEKATVQVTISYGGLTTEITLPSTDEHGQTQGVLDLPGVEPGQKVTLQIEAFGGAETSLGGTMLSFKTWW